MICTLLRAHGFLEGHRTLMQAARLARELEPNEKVLPVHPPSIHPSIHHGALEAVGSLWPSHSEPAPTSAPSTGCPF